MRVYFLRHATMIATIHRINILIDPMLSPAAAMPAVANTVHDRRIPLVDLPLTDEELDRALAAIDLVLITHHHRDHWDARAVELLPKDVPILCQPSSEAAIREGGFTAVTPIEENLLWNQINFCRTDGRHGTGEIGAQMGAVSGFVLSAPGEPVLYIAGDTIWCSEVQSALRTYHPDVVIVNAGAAQFLTGGPITMTAEDVSQVCRELPSAQVVAVHMEAVNHCLLTRDALRSRLIQEQLAAQVQVPADGELLMW
jgi:L-ascorbate metabolism protein UlaG (beta-lactamase superfamily)